MISVSIGPAQNQCLVLAADNQNIGANAVIPLTARHDPAARWDAAQFRLTAGGTEVWRVSRLSGELPADRNIVAFISGVTSGQIVHTAVYAESAGSTQELGKLLSDQAGEVFVLSAGQYLDFRPATAGAVGPFNLLLERIA